MSSMESMEETLMDNEEETEDGEILDEDEEGSTNYNVLTRPDKAPNTSNVNIVDEEEDEKNKEESESDDSDEEGGGKRRMTQRLSDWSREERDRSRAAFNAMMEANEQHCTTQEIPEEHKRRRGNNVWGQILQEENLTQSMNVIGVKQRHQVHSDRGAEAYDYEPAAHSKSLFNKNVNHSDRSSLSKSSSSKSRQKLDSELDAYFTSKAEECATSEASNPRKRRHVRDRLGSRQASSSTMGTMSIPPPGVSRVIADLDINEDSDDKTLGQRLAMALIEPKEELIAGVVDLVGVEVSMELFEKTKQIELEGGMMTKSGNRRRTPGGVFLQLLRDVSHRDPRVDALAVKKFFTYSNNEGKKGVKERDSKKKESFDQQLADFKRIAEKRRPKEDQLEEDLDDDNEDITRDFENEDSTRDFDNDDALLDVPPNSVEVNLDNDEEDDEVSNQQLNVPTESIELA